LKIILGPSGYTDKSLLTIEGRNNSKFKGFQNTFKKEQCLTIHVVSEHDSDGRAKQRASQEKKAADQDPSADLPNMHEEC
jgi:hypothetical protein